MVTSVGKILKLMDQIAPFSTAEAWDNVGLLIGNPSHQTSRILIALDLTDKIIDEAIEEGIDLIITHHPIIFTPLKRIVATDAVGRKVIRCIENGIAVIAAHTNLDKAPETGINRAIADAYGLVGAEPLTLDANGTGFGMIGKLQQPLSMKAFIDLTKEVFNISYVKTTPFTEERFINTVAISSGASADFIDDVIQKGADAFILGDLKYHEAQAVEFSKLVLLDVGHYESEVFYLETLKAFLDDHIMSQGYDVYTMISEKSEPILITR